MSSTVHRRKEKGATLSSSEVAGQGAGRSKIKTNADNSNNGITDAKKLTSALQQVREDALANGMSPEDFQKCAMSAAKQFKLHPLKTKGHRHSKVQCVILTFKVLWLIFLMLLTLAILTAAVKPVTFYMHKVLHTYMYSITRPVRLGLVSVLPFFQKLGIDFFHNDCVVENPFLGEDERCPCTHIKHPTLFTINSSLPQLPDGLLHTPLTQIVVVEKGISIPPSFSIDRVVRFGESGVVPIVCTEMTVDQQDGLLFYQHLFNKRKMMKYLQKQEPWTFSWEECPDERNPSSLRSLFPGPSTFLPPQIDPSTNALFSLSTQWSPSSHYHELFSGHRLILFTVVMGELRFSPEPRQDSECMHVCTGFKDNPVLQQGDSLIFDQHFWSFQATTWSKVALTYSVALT